MTRQAAVRDYGGVSAEERRGDRRRRLLAAGRHTWGSSGVADIGVRGVCRDAELAHRYFYESFDNRDAFIVAIADQVRSELMATLVDASTADGGTIEERLRAALTAFLLAVSDDPSMLSIMTADVSSVAGLENRRRETLDLVAEVVLAHLAALPGSTITGDAVPELHKAAQFVVGGVNRLVENWLIDRDVTVDRLADTCTRLCMAAAAGV